MPHRRPICAAGGTVQFIGLLLGCTLRRSEVVGLTLDRYKREQSMGHRRLSRQRKTPTHCGAIMVKQLLDVWLQCSGVSEGEVFRRISKQGKRQEAGVTANAVWYAVKRCTEPGRYRQSGTPRSSALVARLCHDCNGELEQIRFLLGHASVQTTERYIGSKQKLQDAVNDRFRHFGRKRVRINRLLCESAAQWRQRPLSFATWVWQAARVLALARNGDYSPGGSPPPGKAGLNEVASAFGSGHRWYVCDIL